jgi:hypothetical protein
MTLGIIGTYTGPIADPDTAFAPLILLSAISSMSSFHTAVCEIIRVINSPSVFPGPAIHIRVLYSCILRSHNDFSIAESRIDLQFGLFLYTLSTNRQKAMDRAKAGNVRRHYLFLPGIVCNLSGFAILNRKIKFTDQ